MQIKRITVRESLLQSLQKAGCSVTAACGGRGSCGKCAVRVLSGAVAASAADRARFSPEELENGWRLACTAHPAAEITAEIPDTGEENFSVLDNFTYAQAQTVNNKSAGTNYGIAVDLGTTTIVCVLVDINSGRIIARYSTVNKQREYGADVISRIQSANAGNLLQLSRMVRAQISEGIRSLCAEASLDLHDIGKIVIAGNTVMLHILMNLSCQTLGQAPFTPVTLDLTVMPFHEIFESSSANAGCEVVILPGISTYVGADIAAGILCTGLHKSTAPALLIDIGTNGEIALCHEGKILCAATAAGPAFEAGNILWGTGSVAGAISRVRFCDNAFEVSTIDDKPPVGICGSGLVDAAYQGLVHGMILMSGRFSADYAGGIALAKTADGREIMLCQKDVRELQLAKSAIRAGLDALLHHALCAHGGAVGLAYNDIQTVYIAGGFGANLSMESAAGIALIPAALLPKVTLAGNSALGGAVAYLCASASTSSAECDAQLMRIIKQSTEFNLPDDKYFSENFINNLNF